MLIEESPLVHAVSVNVPDALIVKIKLRGFTPKRSDILGSTTKAKVYLSVNYHKGGDSSTSWYREYLISDARWNPIYEEEVFNILVGFFRNPCTGRRSKKPCVGRKMTFNEEPGLLRY